MSPPDVSTEREPSAADAPAVSAERRGAVRRRLATVRGVLVRVLFGDRLGLVVFLGVLVFVGLYWRVGFFINDSYTLANALVSLADGNLRVVEAVYGPGLETPGMGVRDGQYYARNYGQLAFTLPFLWAFQAVAVVADPGLILPMCWSLLVVALGVVTGRYLDRPSQGATAGAALALVAFVANVGVATPLSPELLPVVAHQAASTVAAALAVVTLYRLVARIHGHRVGFAAGAVTALATPVGFWASIPKRHTFVLALVFGVCYALYRSREDPSGDALVSSLGFRALAYGLVGLLTWVHGGEAFAVFLALVVVDLPTARSNDVRSLAVVGAVFAVSLLPFLATNALVTGHPLRTPRMLGYLDVPGDVVDGGGRNAGETAGNGASGGPNGQSGGDASTLPDVVPSAVAGPFSTALDYVVVLFGRFVAGLVHVVEDSRSLLSIFVRGGDLGRVTDDNFGETIYLTVTEAAPVVVGVAAALATGVARTRRSLERGVRTRESAGGSIRATAGRLRSRLGSLDPSPATVSDGFLLGICVLFLLLYVRLLPSHAQITVRYLLPVYPVAVYAMVRQSSLRRVLATHWRASLWTWAGGVLLGAQAFVVVVAVQSLSQGEAVQVHALVGLAGGALFAALAVATVATDRFDRATAVAGGLAAALGTDFLLLSGLVYFRYGQYALPAAGWVADLLATA